MGDNRLVSTLRVDDDDIASYFQNVIAVMWKYFHVDDAENILASYLKNYIADTSSENDDFWTMWNTFMQEGDEMWQAQYILGTSYINRNFPQYWNRDFIDSPRDFERSVISDALVPQPKAGQPGHQRVRLIRTAMGS
jgi:hypothetical protein